MTYLKAIELADLYNRQNRKPGYRASAVYLRDGEFGWGIGWFIPGEY